MNKKTISILIMFALLCVFLTSMSYANETDVALDSINLEESATSSDISSENEVSQNSTYTSKSDESVNYTEISSDENITDGFDKEGNDVVVPSDPEKLRIFNVLMNFNTPNMLNNFATILSVKDNVTYSEVISILRDDDRNHLFEALSKLDQKDLDEFFDLFLIMNDDGYIMDDDFNQNDAKEIISKISGVDEKFHVSRNKGLTSDNCKYTQQTRRYHSKVKYPRFTYTRISSKDVYDDFDEEYYDDVYNYQGKKYTLYGFIDHLINLYENGEISLDDFFYALKEYDIDTSKIVVNEDGSMDWGYLHVFEPYNDEIMEDSIDSNTNIPEDTLKEDYSDSEDYEFSEATNETKT